MLSFLLALPGGFTEAAKAETSAKLKLPPINSLKMKNGLRVIHIHDEIPQVVFVASIGYGRLYENRDTAGAGLLIARMLNLGGSEKFPGGKLHEALEDIGARLSVSAEWEQLTISVQVLQRYHERALEILSDLVLHPRFSTEHYEMAQAMVKEELRRRYDEPSQLAFDRVRSLVFMGKSYGSTPTAEGTGRIKLPALKKIWDSHVRAANTVLGVTSPLQKEDIFKKITLRFGSMRRGKRMEYFSDVPGVRKNVEEKRNRIYFIEKNIPQATIVLGTLAPVAKSDGRYSLEIMNRILGGGSFNSRLVKDIRVKRGLAYTVQSIYRGRKNAGLFLVFTQVKTDKVPLVLGIIDDHLKKISTEKVTEKEADWIKKYIKNSYIFKFDTPLNVLSALIGLQYYELPLSYTEEYTGKIEQVSREEIQKNTARLLRSGYIRVIVGDKKLAEELKKKNEVVRIQ